MTMGHIHSWESMGLVDGPGIRTVIFLQGCCLRCQYCHNPDTWEIDGRAETKTPEEIIAVLNRFKPYYGSTGGVTFSGGEPLLQKDFLAETLALCKEQGIHTCLDTAGYGNGGYGDILKHTDLVLFDVKHYTREGYLNITGQPMDESLRFLQAVQEFNIPLWIRHVAVPGLTDSREHLMGLFEAVKQIKNVQRVELLPYHVLGVPKYKAMGIPYRLEQVPPKDASELEQWQNMMNEYFQN